MLAEPGGRVPRGRTADECVTMTGQLELELRVGLRLVPHALELLEGAHQSLRHLLPAIGTEAAVDRVRRSVAGHLHQCLAQAYAADERADLARRLHPHIRRHAARNV